MWGYTTKEEAAFLEDLARFESENYLKKIYKLKNLIIILQNHINQEFIMILLH